MKLYSVDGNVLAAYANDSTKNWITGLYRCPEWPSQKSDMLISYNNSGGGGAIWDTLATFDDKLNPIAVLNCAEGRCGGTSFFGDINDNRYISVSAKGGFDNTLWQSNNAKQYINYDQSWPENSGNKYFYTWSLWSLDNGGKLNPVIQATERYHEESITPNSWREIIDIPYPGATLMGDGSSSGNSPQGEILTSIKVGKILILYRIDHRYYGTTIVPVP